MLCVAISTYPHCDSIYSEEGLTVYFPEILRKSKADHKITVKMLNISSLFAHKQKGLS